MSASETGEGAFAVRIVAGRHELTGDEPESAGGRDLGPNPLELLAGALAECTSMTVRWFADRQGWPVDHVSVSVEHVKTIPAGATGPVDVFEKVVSVRAPELTADQRSRLLEIAGRCPVQRMLEGTPIIRTRMDAPRPGAPPT